MPSGAWSRRPSGGGGGGHRVAAIAAEVKTGQYQENDHRASGVPALFRRESNQHRGNSTIPAASVKRDMSGVRQIIERSEERRR